MSPLSPVDDTVAFPCAVNAAFVQILPFGFLLSSRLVVAVSVGCFFLVGVLHVALACRMEQ